MFITPKEKGLTQDQINKICEDLWAKEKPKRCPDCGVDIGEIHGDYCDVSHCLNCGEQTIFEDCCGNIKHDTWTGIWPGVKECYENKLICYDTCRYPDNGEELGWGFDLNKWALMNMTNLIR